MGRSALHIAALNGMPLVVDALLHEGVSIDEKDETGMTPLMIAVDQEYDDVA